MKSKRLSRLACISADNGLLAGDLNDNKKNIYIFNLTERMLL